MIASLNVVSESLGHDELQAIDDLRINQTESDWISISLQRVSCGNSSTTVSGANVVLLTLLYWGAPLMDNQIKLIGWFGDQESAERHASSLNLEVLG